MQLLSSTERESCGDGVVMYLDCCGNYTQSYMCNKTPYTQICKYITGEI